MLVGALDHTVALHQDVMARTDLLTLLSVGRLPGGGGAGDADTYSLRPVQPPTAATYARLVRPFLLGHLRLDGDDGDTSITRSMLQVIRNDPDFILFSERERVAPGKATPNERRRASSFPRCTSSCSPSRPCACPAAARR